MGVAVITLSTRRCEYFDIELLMAFLKLFQAPTDISRTSRQVVDDATIVGGSAF